MLPNIALSKSLMKYVDNWSSLFTDKDRISVRIYFLRNADLMSFFSVRNLCLYLFIEGKTQKLCVLQKTERNYH